eukprot:2453580-Amphidinium_carterae.1
MWAPVSRRTFGKHSATPSRFWKSSSLSAKKLAHQGEPISTRLRFPERFQCGVQGTISAGVIDAGFGLFDGHAVCPERIFPASEDSAGMHWRGA